jgi:hypothetical protein
MLVENRGRRAAAEKYRTVYPRKVEWTMGKPRRYGNDAGIGDNVFFITNPELDFSSQIERIVRIGAVEDNVFRVIMRMRLCQDAGWGRFMCSGLDLI